MISTDVFNYYSKFEVYLIISYKKNISSIEMYSLKIIYYFLALHTILKFILCYELEMNITTNPPPPPPPFDINLANASVWFSATASCGKDNYPTHDWKGPCEGFVYKGLIYDSSTDTQGKYYYNTQNL